MCVCVGGGVFRAPRAHFYGILHHAPEGQDPSPPGRATLSWAWSPQYRSKSHVPPRTPALRSTVRALPPGGEGRATRAAPAPVPLPHRPPQVPGAGRMGAADRPGLLPAPTAAASVPGRRRRRRLERVAGPGGGAASALETPPCGNPARGLCVLSNYLFIEKKGGREKKEVTCPGYTYAKRSSRRREKLRRAGGGREAAAEAAAAREAAAAARPGTDTHLYECACGS